MDAWNWSSCGNFHNFINNHLESINSKSKQVSTWQFTGKSIWQMFHKLNTLKKRENTKLLLIFRKEGKSFQLHLRSLFKDGYKCHKNIQHPRLRKNKPNISWEYSNRWLILVYTLTQAKRAYYTSDIIDWCQWIINVNNEIMLQKRGFCEL